MTLKRALAGALLVLLLYFLLAYSIYNSLTSRVPGANDFYSRWFGARALFLTGQNPYSLEVTQGIQIGMMGRLATPEEDQVAFAYPLYAAFLVLPLVSLAYAQAQALWMAAMIIAVIAGVLVLLRPYRVSMTPRLLVVLVFSTLLFYPSTRAILLGQFALVSFLFLALACRAILARQDIAAGVFLALATVKPQTASLLVLCVLGWALLHKRWHLVTSAAGSLFTLVALACLWLPTWPLEFLHAMVDYTGYIRVGAPVQTVLSFLLSAALAGPGAIVLGLALVALAALEWSRAADDILPAFNLTAFVTTWTAIRIGSSDQVLLLFPWLYWLLSLWRSGHRKYALVIGLGLLVIPWAVFLMTLRGNAEDPVVTIVLPVLTLASYLAIRLVNANWISLRGEA